MRRNKLAAYILLDIQTDPNRLEEMRAFLHDRMPEAMAFDGCLGVELVENIEKPGNLFFFEKWESHAHYEKYYAFREASGVLEAFSEMLTEEPVFRFMDLYKY
jgi:quinol monooxygenase YgiN